MTRKIFLLLAVCFSSTAMAGDFFDIPVEIFYPGNDPAQEPFGASGVISAARFSASEVEFIGCGVRRVSSDAPFGGPSFGFCRASDAAGNTHSCGTFDLELMDSMDMATSDSFLLFFGRPFDANNEGEVEFLQDVRRYQQYCTVVQVSTESLYIPTSKDTTKAKE